MSCEIGNEQHSNAMARASVFSKLDGRSAHESTGGRIKRKCVAVIGLVLVAAAPAFAQQDWPPDDNSSQAPYAQAPDYQQPYGQQQYAQPQYEQQPGYGQQQYAPNAPYGLENEPSYPQQPQSNYVQQPMSPDQLQQLVAPIALYPDNLVAEILAASTYPAQVPAADQWLRMQGNAPAEQIVAGANAQASWDPSIKALTAFPQVLAMMDRNLQWTTSLGNAYYNQPQDVLQTIQVMRDRAEAAGSLQSTPQETVNDDQGYVNIAPANPQVVYVPSYNPWEAYGQPVDPYPGFSVLGAIGSFLGDSLINYGPGIAMNAFMATPWGWLGWGLDWLSHAVLFNHGDYFTHSRSVADWGFPHGGPRYFPGRPAWGGGRDGWNRGGERAYGNRGWGRGGTQAYGNGLMNRGELRGGPSHSWGDARTQEGFNRGMPQRGEVFGRPSMPVSPRGEGYVRPAMPNYNRGYEQNYNRGSEQFGRQQAFVGRGSEGMYGAYGRQQENFGGRPGMSYGTPSRTYATPQNSFRGQTFGGGRSYSGYSDFGGKQQHSGGFHLFGGGPSNEYKVPKGFGGGRSSWGGGGGFKAPKAPKMSGGGHWGGGGHSFGGGHSGGGHHSGGGGHGGGHHH